MKQSKRGSRASQADTAPAHAPTHLRMACQTASKERGSKQRESNQPACQHRRNTQHTHTQTKRDGGRETDNDDVAGVDKELHPGIATILLQQPRPKFCNSPSRLLVSKVWSSDSGAADARALEDALSHTLLQSLQGREE